MGHSCHFHGSGPIREASPRKNALFLSTHLPHLPFGIPSRYGTSVCFTPLSIPNWPYAVSVRQVRDLPAPSFRSHLTVSLLVFGYDLLEQSKDLHPLRVHLCRAHKNTAWIDSSMRCRLSPKQGLFSVGGDEGSRTPVRKHCHATFSERIQHTLFRGIIAYWRANQSLSRWISHATSENWPCGILQVSFTFLQQE